jgi:hypothetical protein
LLESVAVGFEQAQIYKIWKILSMNLIALVYRLAGRWRAESLDESGDRYFTASAVDSGVPVAPEGWLRPSAAAMLGTKSIG